MSRPALIPVICGPTAGGKSDLAVRVALRLIEQGLPAEVLAADAFQIYRGMDVGTAKPNQAERHGVPHRLIDLVEPEARFTVADWLAAAESEIERVRAGGGVPIIVGGTHLYVKALLDGLFEGPSSNPQIRSELGSLTPEALRAELERVDPGAAAKLHPNDLRRTIRAIEVFRLTGQPISRQQQQWDRGSPQRDAIYLLVGLDWPVEAINRRINARVRGMFERGLLAEVRALWAGGRLGPQAREALGYKQLVEHLEGRISLDDAAERIKIETRRFAKNQRTWLKRLRQYTGSSWIDAGATDPAAWPDHVLHAMEPRMN